VYEDPSEEHNRPATNNEWTPGQDNRLIQLVLGGSTFSDIHEEFPERTSEEYRGRLEHLKKVGLVPQPLVKGKAKKPRVSEILKRKKATKNSNQAKQQRAFEAEKHVEAVIPNDTWILKARGLLGKK
jgi:hypothetical protein